MWIFEGAIYTSSLLAAPRYHCLQALTKWVDNFIFYFFLPFAFGLANHDNKLLLPSITRESHVWMWMCVLCAFCVSVSSRLRLAQHNCIIIPVFCVKYFMSSVRRKRTYEMAEWENGRGSACGTPIGGRASPLNEYDNSDEDNTHRCDPRNKEEEQRFEATTKIYGKLHTNTYYVLLLL